jgi:hypothetical protein
MIPSFCTYFPSSIYLTSPVTGFCSVMGRAGTGKSTAHYGRLHSTAQRAADISGFAGFADDAPFKIIPVERMSRFQCSGSGRFVEGHHSSYSAGCKQPYEHSSMFQTTSTKQHSKLNHRSDRLLILQHRIISNSTEDEEPCD